MIEEFDAIQSLNLSQLFIYAAGLVLIGVILEAGFRFGQRWALAKNYTWLTAILRALAWQPLFWGLVLGAIWPVWRLVEEITGWQWGAGLLHALVPISVTIILVRLINGLLKILTARTPSASVSLLNNLVTGVGALVVAVIAAGYLFDISTVVLLVTIVGAVTGLTVVFQEPLNNLVSGVSLTVSNRLAPGNWIRLPSGIEGQVVDIQWDVTLVRQLLNNVIVLPNKVMTEAEIINYDQPTSELRILVPVGVSYDSDLARVEQVTLEVANMIMHQVNRDTPTMAPLIRYTTFADFSINFNVVLAAAKYDDQFLLKHEFIKGLHRRYDEEGIMIPFPIRTLHTRPNRPVALVNQGHQDATEVE